jgi:hypothetical protein
MVVLYFSEFTLELIERAEAFMGVVSPQIDNPPRFWLPPYDTDGDASSVTKPPVEFSHSAFSPWLLKSPTTHSANG